MPKGLRSDGMMKRGLDGSPEDENSNKGSSGGKRIGPIVGKLNRYKSSVADLNTGEWKHGESKGLSNQGKM